MASNPKAAINAPIENGSISRKVSGAMEKYCKRNGSQIQRISARKIISVAIFDLLPTSLNEKLVFIFYILFHSI